jgi:hypothetical protein
LPDPERIAAFGMTLEDFEEPPLPVWPENRQAAIVFMAMQTQWIAGGMGFTGLNYAALDEVWRRLRVRRRERDAVFGDLQRIEVAALNTMHERN